MENVLAIDIGGTKISVALLSNGKILEIKNFPTESKPEYAIQKIEEMHKSFNEKIKSLSLSLPGIWDKNGVLVESNFLSGWIKFPFVEKLKESLGISDCVWDTDVVCGALGEWKDYKTSLLYINLGTGIGAAFIDKNGKPFGKGLPTLRMQKMVIPIGEELNSAVDLISGGTIVLNSKFTSVPELFKAYKDLDVEAIDIISNAQSQLAAWLINLYYLFAPEVIVLNGGLTNDYEVLCDGAIDIAYEELEGKVKIIPSKLKERAPIIGAYVNSVEHTSSSVK